MLDADVYIAKMDRDDVVHDYYKRCGYEMAGPNFLVKANEPRTITCLEDLADMMLKSTAWVQLIVCHGDPVLGLLLPLVKGARHNKTGQVIHDLAELASHFTDMTKKDKKFEGRVQHVMSNMGVNSRESLERLIGKLSQLKQTKYKKNIVEIRGCHLAEGDGRLMQAYRQTLGTHMLSAPACRQLYLPINPANPANPPPKVKQYLGKTSSMEALDKGRPLLSRCRRRLFGKLGATNPDPIIIDVEDIDGHANVTAHPFMDKPSNASAVAPQFIRNWNQAKAGTNSDKFVLPVMFDNYENSYHVPLEGGYLSKLKTVTY